MESFLDLHRLEIFCKVVEFKNFTRAAEAMYLSQPTVSEHIRYLEEILGETLIDRMGREVLPTPAGRILYEYAKKMLRLREQTIQALKHFKGSISGTLYLGSSTIPGTYILPYIICKLRESYPEVVVSLQIAGSRAVVDMLIKGDIEIGFTGAKWNDSKLEWNEFCLDEIVLAVNAVSPYMGKKEIFREDLVNIPLILRERGSGTRKVTEDILGRHGIVVDSLKIVAELGSTEAVKQGILAGLGGSFISRFALQDERGSEKIIPLRIQGIRLFRPFYYVHLKKRHLLPASMAFLGFVRKYDRSHNKFHLSQDNEKV